MPSVVLASFVAIDWAVLGLYFVVLACTGYVFSRRQQRSTEDYFLGGRRMPVWAVSVSVLATGLSAATFIGGPQLAYEGNLTYLATNIGMLLAAVVIAVWFIPAYYRARVQTVYQLLDTRFGTGAMLGASAAFMIGRVFASGTRLFIVGLPAALIMFGEQPGAETPPWQYMVAIGAITIVGICYTLVGGIASVIWSDVIQTAIFLAAVVGAIWLLLDRIPLPLSDVIGTLSAAETPGDGGAGKLTIIDVSTSLSQPFTLWSAMIGFTLLGIASYGTDQDLMQRMLTCRNAKQGSWSMVSANLIAVPVVMLFMAVGLLLYLFYSRPDVMGDAVPGYEVSDSRKVFLSFILAEMPAGMTGLMMAGLFAAGLSSLNSAINAMSSTLVGDFYKRARPDRSEMHYVRVGRLAVVGWGLLLGAFACFCVYWQRASGETLIQFALGVMTFAYSGLLGVYFCALFTRRGTSGSAIAALCTGFLLILVTQPVLLRSIAGSMPESTASERMEHIAGIAFSWKLTAAAAVAFGVACIPRGRSGAR